LSAVIPFLTAVLLLAAHASAQSRGSSSHPPSAASKSAKPWIPASTPWGEPDLQGIYSNTDELNIPLERPEQFAGRTLAEVTAAELAEFARASNEERRQTFEQNPFRGLTAVDRFDLKPSRRWLVVDPVDGKVPPLTVEGQRRQAAFAARQNGPADSPEALNLWYRCISLGVPRSMMPSVDGAPFQIVQAPGVVAIRYERMHEVRVIRLDGAPIGSGIRQYMGVSRGHWEGKTLIVESTGFKGENQMTSPASKNLRVLERFTPVAAGRLEWSVTFEDSAGWTRPWTLSMLLTSTTEQLFEDACHEGNYALRNTLSGARAEEQTAH
jgi:hypothetical protein